LIPITPWWQIPTLLAALFWSIKRRPWGIVFDSKTLRPLSSAIIRLSNESGKSWIAMSDNYGRYQFLVEPGQYHLAVEKVSYLFPATSLENKSSHNFYENLYYGEPINVG